MITVARTAPAPRFNVLRTIALYKLVKVLLLLALAYAEVLGGVADRDHHGLPDPSRGLGAVFQTYRRQGRGAGREYGHCHISCMACSVEEQALNPGYPGVCEMIF